MKKSFLKDRFAFVFRLLKTFLKQPKVNHFVRLFLPPALRKKFPVHGLLSVKLGAGKHIKILTNPEDALGTILYLNGLKKYEPEVLPLFRQLLRESRVFFDIGAHTGLYSLIAAAENPQLEIYAFEPVPEIFTYLTRNIDINRFSNIQAHQEALTNKDGQLDFYVPECDGIPMVASANKEFRKHTRRISVKAAQLDSFVLDHKITRVDLLKIDTETTEAQVLEGAEQTIRRYRPIIFCEVLPPTDVSEFNDFFSDKNYRYCLLTEEGMVSKFRIENHPKCWNYLFVPGECWTRQSTPKNLILNRYPVLGR